MNVYVLFVVYILCAVSIYYLVIYYSYLVVVYGLLSFVFCLLCIVISQLLYKTYTILFFKTIF